MQGVRYNIGMHIRNMLLALVFLAAISSPSGSQSVNAQQQAARYFTETGHWVSGDFLQFYEDAPDPLLVFGYPITEAMQDSLSGRTVQYFQRARFELLPDQPNGQRVRLSPLGEWLLREGERVQVPIEPSSCQYFAGHKHFVCFTFLDFFKAHGGVDIFGEPVSEMEKQDNLYVQYFERARFEWHPELPPGQRVTLTDLGSIYFDQRLGDPSYLAPIPRDNLPQSLIQIKGRAFVSKAVAAANSQQTLYVVVQDQYLRPVAGAAVSVMVVFPNGEEQYQLPNTDANGLTQLTFSIGDQPVARIVRIKVHLTYGGREALAETWFYTWW